MRPRSTPIRRATISAGSPTKHQPYINVSEVQVGNFSQKQIYDNIVDYNFCIIS